MKPIREVGIVGYGAYVPRYRIKAAEVGRVWGEEGCTLPIVEKSVPGLDEDTATMAIEAARNALRRAAIEPRRIGAVWVGTESKPYAVKPTSTIVAEAIGAVPEVTAADWEFACKAGTETIQAAIGFVGSGMAEYAMGIGVDTAQGRPGDELDYTVGAGGAAYIIGPKEESLASLEGSYSYVSDTPDFFRRPQQHYPQHGGKFTGAPAYFKHTIGAARGLMEKLGYGPEDYAAAVFHQPNTKFPCKVAEMLGFTMTQIETGLLVPEIGNTYAGSSLLGLTAVLDKAKPRDRVLIVSFGSGAGSDALSFVVTGLIKGRRGHAPFTENYVKRKLEIDYATYVRFKGELQMS